MAETKEHLKMLLIQHEGLGQRPMTLMQPVRENREMAGLLGFLAELEKGIGFRGLQDLELRDFFLSGQEEADRVFLPYRPVRNAEYGFDDFYSGRSRDLFKSRSNRGSAVSTSLFARQPSLTTRPARDKKSGVSGREPGATLSETWSPGAVARPVNAPVMPYIQTEDGILVRPGRPQVTGAGDAATPGPARISLSARAGRTQVPVTGNAVQQGISRRPQVQAITQAAAQTAAGGQADYTKATGVSGQAPGATLFETWTPGAVARPVSAPVMPYIQTEDGILVRPMPQVAGAGDAATSGPQSISLSARAVRTQVPVTGNAVQQGISRRPQDQAITQAAAQTTAGGQADYTKATGVSGQAPGKMPVGYSTPYVQTADGILIRPMQGVSVRAAALKGRTPGRAGTSMPGGVTHVQGPEQGIRYTSIPGMVSEPELVAVTDQNMARTITDRTKPLPEYSSAQSFAPASVVQAVRGLDMRGSTPGIADASPAFITLQADSAADMGMSSMMDVKAFGNENMNLIIPSPEAIGAQAMASKTTETVQGEPEDTQQQAASDEGSDESRPAVDIESLAYEMASRIMARLKREKERRGLWD